MSILLSLFPLVILAVIGWFFYYFWTKKRTITSKANKAMVITGPNLKPDKGLNNIVFNEKTGKKIKIVQGGSVYIRRFQTYEYINLQSIQLEAKGENVPTKEGVPVTAQVVVMLKVDNALEGLVRYSEQWLDKKPEEVKEELEAILNAIVRSILSSMTVEQINQDRQAFSEEVQKVAEPQLLNMGFKVLSLNLSTLSDDNNYIKNLGLEKISEVEKITAIGVAENQKEQSNAEAELRLENQKVLKEMEKEQSDLELQANAKILENKLKLEKQEKEKALALEKIEIQKETETQKALKAKELELASQDAEIEKIRSERKLELERIDAESEKVKIDLDAYNKMKSNEIEANKLTTEGKAKSEVVLAEGEAQAKAVRLKGEAEAEIEEKLGKIKAENKRLEAEAIAQNSQFMLAQEFIKVLPQLAEANAKAFSSIDSVKIYDGGGNDSSEGGVNKYATNVMNNLLQTQDLLKDLVGVDMSEIIYNESVKGNTQTTVILPEDSNKNLLDTKTEILTANEDKDTTIKNSSLFETKVYPEEESETN